MAQHNVTKQQVQEALEASKRPVYDIARKQLGITSPNAFYAILRQYGLHSSTAPTPQDPKYTQLDFLE